jgi:hypothetical protein
MRLTPNTHDFSNGILQLTTQRSYSRKSRDELVELMPRDFIFQKDGIRKRVCSRKRIKESLLCWKTYVEAEKGK